MSIKVKLLKKAISKNRHSYYLDFYPAVRLPDSEKPTRREFLGLYIYDNPKDKTEREHNKQITTIAEQCRDKRTVELNKPEVYSTSEKEILAQNKKTENSFIDFFNKQVDKRTGSNKKTWGTVAKYLDKFSQSKLRFCDLTETFCNDFKTYLLITPAHNKTTLSQNTAGLYYRIFKTVLHQAYKDGYLKIDLNVKIETIKEKETHRNYLSLEELNTLIDTPAPNPVTKPIRKAAILSALTGLRYSDIEKLTWSEVQHSEAQGYYLQYTQQKTKHTETLQITAQALQLLGERGAPEAKVIPNLKYSLHYTKLLTEWITAAGITKHITFHCFRHTYATLLLTEGEDMFTVSKMLGHKNLKTTQIYGKIVDSKKRIAADRIQLNFTENTI